MSFSNDAKKEALATTQSSCCRKAQFCGAYLSAMRVCDDSIRFTFLSPSVFEYFISSSKKIFEIIPNVSGKCTIILPTKTKEQIEAVFSEIKNRGKDCCKIAFLRGVFLSTGRLTDPNKDYSLEFELKTDFMVNEVFNLLNLINYPPKKTKRGNSVILYYKVSEQIEDLLNIMGMTFSALEIMNTKISKQVRNDINRVNNFDIANTAKITKTAVNQARLIQKLIDSGKFLTMPPELKVIGNLRLANPEISMAQLGAMCDPPIGKSAIKRRFDKIQEYLDKEE